MSDVGTFMMYLLYRQGLNAALFYENPDPRSYVSLVPTSAVTGEGMGNLLAMIVQACEGPLHKRLVFSNQLLATVLEVTPLCSPGLCVRYDYDSHRALLYSRYDHDTLRAPLCSR